MRVTLVSRDFPPRPGGIADHTHHLARALTERGHDLTVVCAPPADPRETFEVRPTTDVVDAARRSTPDAIVWQYNPFSIGSRGLANGAGRRARDLAAIAPLTLFLHELWFPWGRAGARGLVWSVAQRLQTRSALRAATHWIVTTPDREAALRARDAARTHRIPVGTNIEPVEIARLQARERLGIARDAFVVVHLGSTGPGRDLQPVAEATERAGMTLLLAGDTGPDRPHGPLVIAPGRRPPEELSTALRAADVYVHADPVGASAGRRTTLVAALAHGLPVVAYRGPDRAPELDGAVVEVPRESRAVEAALVALRDDPGTRAQLGAKAREIFDAHFSWRRIAEDVEAVLLGR